MTAAVTARFEHWPLDTTRHQIRLVKVTQSSRKARAHHGPQSRELISCLVEHYDLKEDHVARSIEADRRPRKVKERPLQYTAVSYTWGDETNPAEIMINGSPFSVRRNLYDFLCMVSQQSEHANRLLWIDQLCIDQCRTSERNHQVQLMANIFMRAEQVIAWLGMDTEITATMLRVLDVLEVVSKKYPMDTDFPGRGTMDERMLSEGIRQEHALALTDLFARPYWSRLWIMQEVFLARKLLFVSGSHTFEAPRGAHARTMLTLLISWPTSKVSPVFASSGWRHFYSAVYLLISNEEFSKRRESSVGEDRNYFLSPFLVYNSYVELECADLRDKVFGLQACLRPGYRVTIGYSLGVDQVFRLLHDVLRDVKLSDGVESLFDKAETLVKVAKAMGLKDKDVMTESAMLGN